VQRLSPAVARVSLGVLGALALVALGAVLDRLAREPTRAPARPPSFVRLTLEMGDIAQPSVSPEGQSFAYVGEEGGDSDIFVQRVGGTNAVNLTADSPENESTPTFSPDGSRIAFYSSRGGGGIFVMGATGEATRRLTESGTTPSWSPDGREIVYSTQGISPSWPYLRMGFGELWAVDVATGAKRQLTRGAPQDAVQPSWSPGGGRIAYWGLRGVGGQRDIWTVASSGLDAAPVEVTNDAALDWNPVWSPDGRFLYFASDRAGTMGLWRVAIDETTGSVRGEPEAISVPSAYVCGMSFTRDGGKLLLTSLAQTDSIERIAFDPARVAALGEPKAVFASALWLWASLGVASDGGSVAFSSTGLQEDVYVLERDGQGLRQLTNDGYRDRGPIFAPDGETVVFYSNRSGQYEMWSVRLDGSRMTQLTRTEGQEVTTPNISPDGRLLAVRGRGGGGRLLIARLSGAGEPASPEALPSAPGDVRFDYASWSLDGKKLAGLLLHPSGQRTLGVHELGTSHFDDLGVEAEIPVAWLTGGRDLMFLDHGRLRSVEIASKRVRDVEVKSASGGPGASQWISAFGLSRDRRSLYVLRSRVYGEIWQITPP
jgi:Tol biopolymer transport system component